MVYAQGVLPLLAAPLVPYKTVGFFMFGIMAVSSVATLFILPSIISARPKAVFEISQKAATCKCAHCILIALFVAFGVAYVLFGYTTAGWKISTLLTIAVIVAFSAVCHFAARRKICLVQGGKR